MADIEYIEITNNTGEIAPVNSVVLNPIHGDRYGVTRDGRPILVVKFFIEGNDEDTFSFTRDQVTEQAHLFLDSLANLGIDGRYRYSLTTDFGFQMRSSNNIADNVDDFKNMEMIYSYTGIDSTTGQMVDGPDIREAKELRFNRLAIKQFYIVLIPKDEYEGGEMIETNDCLYNALEDYLTIDSASKLKKKLNIARNDKIHYKWIEYIDQHLIKEGYGINFIHSHFVYFTNKTNVQLIHLKLYGGHYELYKPKEYSSEINIYRRDFVGEKIQLMVVDTINNVSYNGKVYKEESQLYNKNAFTLNISKRKVDNDEKYKNLKEMYNNLLEVNEEVNNDLMYFQNLKDYALYTFLKYNKFDLPNIAPNTYEEYLIFHKIYNGGLMHCRKNYKGYAYCVDARSFYPSLLIDKYFEIPISTFTKQFAKYKSDMKKLGFHRVIVKDTQNGKYKKLVKLNRENLYTNYDIALFQELDYEVKYIEDGKPNIYMYSEKIKSKEYFEKYIKKFDILRQRNPENMIYKLLLNILWGSLCQKVKKSNIHKLNENFKITSGVLTTYDLQEKCVETNTINPFGKLYKTNFGGRFACFLTSYGRYMLGRKLKSNVDSIVRIHTDGVFFNKKVDVLYESKGTNDRTNIVIGDKLGLFKEEEIDIEEMVNVNHIILKNVI